MRAMQGDARTRAPRRAAATARRQRAPLCCKDWPRPRRAGTESPRPASPRLPAPRPAPPRPVPSPPGAATPSRLPALAAPPRSIEPKFVGDGPGRRGRGCVSPTLDAQWWRHCGAGWRLLRYALASRGRQASPWQPASAKGANFKSAGPRPRRPRGGPSAATGLPRRAVFGCLRGLCWIHWRSQGVQCGAVRHNCGRFGDSMLSRTASPRPIREVQLCARGRCTCPNRYTVKPGLPRSGGAGVHQDASCTLPDTNTSRAGRLRSPKHDNQTPAEAGIGRPARHAARKRWGCLLTRCYAEPARRRCRRCRRSRRRAYEASHWLPAWL